MIPSDFVRGIDLSHWQSDPIDFTALASQVKFCYLKATDGVGPNPDPKFKVRAAEAMAAGLYVGAYHFYRPGDDPQSQAQFFSATISPQTTGKPLQMPPVLDVERGSVPLDATMVPGIESCASYVQTFTGVKPMIYTSYWNWEALGNPSSFGRYDLWVARYGPEPGQLPLAWADWTIWQYSQSGLDDGVGGPVDTDVFQGDTDAFKTHFGLS